MNSFDKKIKTRLSMHPEMLRSILAYPNEETLTTLIRYQVFESKGAYLGHLLTSLLPQWEYIACDGNVHLGKVIRNLEKAQISPIQQESDFLRANLLRIRVLAETPGTFPFSPLSIQESLLHFLEGADLLADLPQLAVIHFAKDELKPLAADLAQYRLSPLSRRYVQNLFHQERQEAILANLAFLCKNYPLLSTCRQAYALLLSLDNINNWSRHPFCLRLVSNRFWEYRSKEIL
ncbi:hypothetical protein AAC978_06140 [Desulfitobacterium sp. THU1]|uniref:hypothetical protein n=1 Tax=Desulfitobacterium sp. THU1 TaxID=3138072 RepID=UPI00311E825D